MSVSLCSPVSLPHHEHVVNNAICAVAMCPDTFQVAREVPGYFLYVILVLVVHILADFHKDLV